MCCSAFAKKTAEDLAEQYGGDAVCIDSLISGKPKQGQSGEYVVLVPILSIYHQDIFTGWWYDLNSILSSAIKDLASVRAILSTWQRFWLIYN